MLLVGRVFCEEKLRGMSQETQVSLVRLIEAVFESASDIRGTETI